MGFFFDDEHAPGFAHDRADGLGIEWFEDVVGVGLAIGIGESAGVVPAEEPEGVEPGFCAACEAEVGGVSLDDTGGFDY